MIEDNGNVGYERKKDGYIITRENSEKKINIKIPNERKRR